ncbi:MAG: hypothetical protein EBT33_12620 [Betaproteobacteria bacterium]|nr:hypothetical protein [Betaproteobacteria bacterium]
MPWSRAPPLRSTYRQSCQIAPWSELVTHRSEGRRIEYRVIVAPITSKGQPLVCRPPIRLKGKRGRVLLDQLRCVDKAHLAGKLGEIDAALWHPVLLEMLA